MTDDEIFYGKPGVTYYGLNGPLTIPQPTDNTGLIEPVAYEFDRYINGELMAEGVTIEREKTLADACRVAARIASRGPNGEAPVLVLAVPSLLTKGETDAR